MTSALGFTWNTAVLPAPPPPGRIDRALFRVRKLLPEFVFDVTWLEDNPFTFPEVQTLLDGITVGGHKISDAEQVQNTAKAWRRLVALVESGRFVLDKTSFCELHALAAFEEALTWGRFRDGAVYVAGTAWQPPAAETLDAVFDAGLAELQALANPLERALAFFLFGALQQFFYDGNKRTARLMMNGELLRHGWDAISIPAARKLAFNQAMLRFYDGRDGTEMMAFLLDCGGYPSVH